MLYKEASVGKLTCTFASKACFLCLGHKGTQSGEFTQHQDASDLFPWKPYVRLPRRNRFFFFLRRRNAETVSSHSSLKGIFMNFYHMSTQNFCLSLTEGKNLRNFYRSLVNVESLIRESDVLKVI